MAFRSDISINWLVNPRIITVEAPSVEVTIQDLYDTIRRLEARIYNSPFPKIVQAGGKEDNDAR